MKDYKISHRQRGCINMSSKKIHKYKEIFQYSWFLQNDYYNLSDNQVTFTKRITILRYH